MKSDAWYRAMRRPRPQYVKDAISRAQKGRKHQPHEGFQKGHGSYSGTEQTRFKKGITPWIKLHPPGKDPIKRKYSTYKANAKKRGFSFEVTLEEFKKIVTSDCYYCGGKATGIDRVDNTLGYINGNMLSACMICNHMKWNLTKEDFINKCREIAEKASRVGYEI